MLFVGIWFCSTLLTIFNLDHGSWFTCFTASVKFQVFKFGNERLRNCEPHAEQKARMHNHTTLEPEAGIRSHAASDQREQKPVVSSTKLQRTGP